jgi:hypothetical protein
MVTSSRSRALISRNASRSSSTTCWTGRRRWLTVRISSWPKRESAANTLTAKLRSSPVIAADNRRLAFSCS